MQRPPTGTIPETPGSYQFKDVHGRVIYVGKAKSLRARLNNYFQKNLPVKTAQAYASRRRRPSAEAAAKKEWKGGGRFDGESADPEHRRVWGDLPFERLLAIPPRAGEEWPDETTRLGVLARRLWAPILAVRAGS